MPRSLCSRASTVCLIVTILALIAVTPVSHAQQTIHVPADQPTIQAAINAANIGDTVLVSPGTYAENINFNGKAITLTSSDGPAVTIIDGKGNGSVVRFTGSEGLNSVLHGFMIRNGLQNGGFGGGIYIASASPTITGNIITRNHAAVGIGIYIYGGSPLIENNTITANDQTGAGDGGEGGGGILVSGTSTSPSSPPIIGNTITYNSVASGGDGGGISVQYFSSPLIQGNLIKGNSAYNFGGGIALQSYNSPVVVQNLIFNNEIYAGGSGAGLSVWGDAAQVINNTIAGNNAYDHSSGIYVTGTGQNALFINNIVAAVPGQTAVTCDSLYSLVSPVFSHNDAFAPTGLNLSGICDTTTNPGNVSADPLFMSAPNGDFHLKLGSPAMNAGDNTAPNLPQTDFDGNPRITGAAIDLGAYEVVNTSAATISPNNLGFSPQRIGTSSAPQSAILRSTGATPFQISSVQITGGFSETTTCPTLGAPGTAPGVASGSTCSYDVVFAPTISGPETASLTINGTNGTSTVVSLSGTGLGPVVSLSPSKLTFANQQVGTTSSAQTVTLTNSGYTDLNIASLTASAPFAYINNCPPILVAGSICTVGVNFTPILSGTANGTLAFSDNAPGSPHIVSLTGTGLPIPQPVAITLVQHGSKDAGTTTSSSLAFKANNTAGNWIAVAIRAGHSGQTLTVQDSNHNTYHTAVRLNVTVDAPNGDTLAVFYAENIAAGGNTVTVSDNLSGTLRFAIFEYSGIAPANSLDVVAAAQGTSSSPNSGPANTTTSGDLVFGAILTGSAASFTSGPGFTLQELVPAPPNTKLAVEDQVQGTAGMAAANASLVSSDNWGAAIAAFNATTTLVSTSPTITSINPSSGSVGAIVTVIGTHFVSPPTVTFNGIPAVILNWGATWINVQVPSGASTGSAVVTVAGVSSNPMPFTVTVISVSISPAATTVFTGAGTTFNATVSNDPQPINGVIWSLSGSGCSASTCGTVLAMAGNFAANYTAPIAVPVPPTVTLTVTSQTDPTKSATATITIVQTPAPTISTLSPSSGPVGTQVTITGTNFGARQGSSTLTFGGTAAQSKSWSPTLITVLVPIGAASGNVIVTVNGVPSNGVPFSVTPPVSTIALVQHASKDAGTTTSSSLTFPLNNTAGDWIAVAIRAGKPGEFFTVTDSHGNTYHEAVQLNMSVDAESLTLFYAENVAAGANTITVSDNVLGTLRVAVFEYSGVATANSLDVSASPAQGISASPSSGSVATTANGDLLLGVISTADGASFTAGSGSTIEERVPAEPNTKLIVEDRLLALSGTASATASLAASDPWGALLVAFKPGP